MRATIKHIGILRLASGEWNLYDQYPTRSRTFRITSAVPVGRPTCGVSFLSDEAFDLWLAQNQWPVQQALFENGEPRR